MRTARARFPFHKTLESFDFKFQPAIDAKVIRELATSRSIESAENVLRLGPPGVAKTHLAVALGLDRAFRTTPFPKVPVREAGGPSKNEC